MLLWHEKSVFNQLLGCQNGLHTPTIIIQIGSTADSPYGPKLVHKQNNRSNWSIRSSLLHVFQN